MSLSPQALQAQADLLRQLGYEADAGYVEQGMIEFDPEALECLEPRPGFGPERPEPTISHPGLIIEPEPDPEPEAEP